MWEEFPPISTAEWEAAIREELGGTDYQKKLIWHAEGGITVRPYYRRQDSPPGAESAPRFTGQWRAGNAAEIPADAVRADLLQEQGATAVLQIARALAESAGKRSTFAFAVGGNYFFEIAKLRAARQVWARISPAPMIIWSRTSPKTELPHDPASALIRCTTEAMSAIFGGCDVLVLEDAELSAHLWETLPRILAEESHFDQVSDPAGGSYYIEALTWSIAAEAWKVYEESHQGGSRLAQQ
jgi:methylmalonyl-CoA mutase N-terminal domain/subunit